MHPWTLAYALVALASPPPESAVSYGFGTADCIVVMRIRFLNPSSGRRLAFYSSVDPQRPAPDYERFVGAAAIVNYQVKPAKAAIREYVTVLSQSPGLPERAPFSRTQTLVNGAASDLQVFGYDEAAIKPVDRVRMRSHMQRQWRVYRQQLYIDDDQTPFAIIEWKHTLDHISIVQIHAPPAR